YEVLVGLAKLIAPITPFIAEELYRNLTNEESVHLVDYPICDESLINEHIEKKMDLVRNLISIGRYVREEAKIKVRQPLSEALLDGKNKELISDLISLIEEELNIKKVLFVDDLNEYMNLSVKPNFKVVGKVFGPMIKEFQAKLETLNESDIATLQKGGTITLVLGDEEKEITSEMVDIRISSKEGFNVGMENNNFIILNTELTTELIEEGITREMISKVQQLRKNKDFDIVDRIKVYYSSDDEFTKALRNNEEYIKSETLAVELINEKTTDESYNLNDHEVFIAIKKIN
ncbi:MAG: class I tRNA ligase family protein, partial [Bacilli bacterium]|nr:class I tRNA ligase family protein [Bacilli bacterium]